MNNMTISHSLLALNLSFSLSKSISPFTNYTKPYTAHPYTAHPLHPQLHLYTPSQHSPSSSPKSSELCYSPASALALPTLVYLTYPFNKPQTRSSWTLNSSRQRPTPSLPTFMGLSPPEAFPPQPPHTRLILQKHPSYPLRYMYRPV